MNIPQKNGGVFNLKLEDKECSVVTVGASAEGSISVTLAVVIPIMTNAIDVKKGEELLFPIDVKKTSAKRKARSWKDDVVDEAQEKKAVAMSRRTGSTKAKAKAVSEI